MDPTTSSLSRNPRRRNNRQQGYIRARSSTLQIRSKAPQDGVHTIVFAGLITSVCVQHSVFGGFNAGFRVAVADIAAAIGRARHLRCADALRRAYDVTSTDELIKETRESKKRTEPAATAIPPVHQPRTIPRSAVSAVGAMDVASAAPRLPSPSSLHVSLSQLSLDDHHRKHAFSPVSALDVPVN